jgi:ribosomal protein S18 acetylase RimI-like enzyme
VIGQGSVRPAGPDDAEAIARVHVETWRATYAGLVPDHYLLGMSVQGQALRWKKLLRRVPKGQGVLVATSPAGEVVGFGSWGVARNKPPPASGEIQTLYVASDWQGQGLGRALLRALLAGLAREGHGDAYLWVLAENPARFFYERLGGQRVGEQVEPFAGTKLLEYAYRWDGLRV